MFDVEQARELVALLCDDEGDSDEDILDDCRAILTGPAATLNPGLLRRRDRGEIVIFDLSRHEVDLIAATIDDWTTPSTTTARLGDVLRRRLPENRTPPTNTSRGRPRHVRR